MKQHFNGKPVAIKVQGIHQNLQDAILELLNSSQSKKCGRLILIKTNSIEEITLFGEELKDDRLFIVDSFSLVVDRLLDGELNNKAMVM